MSSPTDTTSNLYEIREQTPNLLPHEHGRLLASFQTWAEVSEAVQEMVKAGLNVYIVSPTNKN
jgi:hypothetical protein